MVFREDDGRDTKVGIVSFGHPSGCENGYPAVFTRVASYVDWIHCECLKVLENSGLVQACNGIAFPALRSLLS